MNNEQDIYELYYQSWIKRHLRKILLSAFIITTIGFVIEMRAYIQNQHLTQAQTLLESYLESPSDKTALNLKNNYPDYTQTHLVLLLEAKQAYLAENTDLAISHLNFVKTHSQDPGISRIATYRLSSLYQQQDNLIKSKSVLKDLSDPYSKLQLALSEKDPQARFEKLNDALDSHPSPYVNDLIATAHNDNIKP